MPLADGDVQGDYRAAGREFIIEPPFRRISGADGWAEENPVQSHSASAVECPRKTSKPCKPKMEEPLLLQLEDFLHQAPLFVAGKGGVGALGLGDKGFPFGLAGQVGKAGHVALEVKVVHGVHDHEHVGAAAEDLHVQDSHLFLALHHFGPYMLVDVAVAADHVRIVQQFKGLAISFHRFFTSFRMTQVMTKTKIEHYFRLIFNSIASGCSAAKADESLTTRAR